MCICLVMQAMLSMFSDTKRQMLNPHCSAMDNL